MAVKIFQNGGMVEVAETGVEVELIPSRSFHFEIEGTYVNIQDLARKNFSKSFLYADVQDETGTPVGIKDQVKDYLAPFVGFNTPGGAGSTTLLGLTDTPSSYTGQSGKVLSVNVLENGTEFITPALSGMLNITLTAANEGHVFSNNEFANVDTTGDVDGILNLYLPPLGTTANFSCRARKKDATVNVIRVHANAGDGAAIDGASFVDITIDDGGLGFADFGDEWGTF
jgi:hypothetical protein